MENGLFPGYKGERKNLRMATPVLLAHKVWHHIGMQVKQLGVSLYSIWDAFGGIGIDSIVASKVLKTTVFVTEKDPPTYQLLQGNIVTQRAHGVVSSLANSLSQPFQCDLIYLDPPWGNQFHPQYSFDFFLYFRRLMVFMRPWCRILVVKTPLLIGPTPPLWKPLYAYRSQKYRIIIWLWDTKSLTLNHTRSIHPLESIDKEDGTNQHGQGHPDIRKVTA